MQKEETSWYASWFESPYYHILYKDRDHTEAAQFMTRLTKHLSLPTNATILDLACGKGRHAVHLANLGYDVTGVDLSEFNITEAKKMERSNLQFHIHDMRISFSKTFDAVFNLFTSFGYFDKKGDNLKTIQAIKNELKPNGYGVIDFLNIEIIKKELLPYEEKTINGITFKISKEIKNGFINKKIAFEDKGQAYNFEENVKAISLKDFKKYLASAGLNLVETLGNYTLEPFNKNTSPRLIVIFKL